MTREQFDKGHILIDRMNKAKAMKEKFKREFPEMQHDKEYKALGDRIIQFFDQEVMIAQDEFNEL